MSGDIRIARAYEAIVIGAGHNGLVLATYLQRAGMRTLLVEQEAAVGGMTSTTEPMLPGFKHNPHANFLAYQEVTPIVRDFQLRERGFATFTPDVQHGIAFRDGRPPVVVYRVERDEDTALNLGKHSERDAKTFRALRSRIDALTPAIRDVLFHAFSPGRMRAHQEAVDAAFRDLGITDRLGTRGAADLIDDLFESDNVRALLYALAVEYGASLTQPGNDLAFLGFTLWMIGRREVPVGGMQSLAAALCRAALSEGVELVTSAPATKIVVDAGRVVGVEMSRQRAEARIVASSIGTQQTLGSLVEHGRMSNREAQALAAYTSQRSPAVASQAFALREPPSYRSARWDSAIDRCIQTYIGFDDAQSVRAHERDLAMGLLPAPRASVRVPSLWDESLAPAGQHVAGADSHFPDPTTLDEGEWQTIEQSYNQALIETWRESAPNMTRDNILASHFARPRPGDRRVLLRDGASQYRTSIEGLYLCGAATFPGGGVHGACAFNAFRDITGFAPAGSGQGP